MLSDVINYLQTEILCHLPFGTSFLFINGVCFKMFLPVYRLILLVKRKFFFQPVMIFTKNLNEFCLFFCCFTLDFNTIT